MTFDENPFRVLNVSIYDDKATIIERARDILLNTRKRIAAEMRYFDEVDIENLFALAADEIRDQINAARAKSKFPAVQDVAAIKDELKNIRDDVRGIVQDTLKAMTHAKRAK